MEDDSEQVLQKIMDDGTFDELRKQVVNHLKQKEELSQSIEEAVLDSKALKKYKTRKWDERALFDEVRRELEIKVLEAALKATWGVLQDETTELPQTIETKVHQALCAVHEERARAEADRLTPQ